jgi:hypothetical protein
MCFFSCLLQGFLTRPIRSAFVTKIMYLFLIFHVHATCPTHHILHVSSIRQPYNAFLTQETGSVYHFFSAFPLQPLSLRRVDIVLYMMTHWRCHVDRLHYVTSSSRRLLWRLDILVSEMWCCVFGLNFCLHVQGRKVFCPNDGGSMLFRNVGKRVPYCAASRRVPEDSNRNCLFNLLAVYLTMPLSRSFCIRSFER